MSDKGSMQIDETWDLFPSTGFKLEEPFVNDPTLSSLSHSANALPPLSNNDLPFSIEDYDDSVLSNLSHSSAHTSVEFESPGSDQFLSWSSSQFGEFSAAEPLPQLFGGLEIGSPGAQPPRRNSFISSQASESLSNRISQSFQPVSTRPSSSSRNRARRQLSRSSSTNMINRRKAPPSRQKSDPQLVPERKKRPSSVHEQLSIARSPLANEDAISLSSSLNLVRKSRKKRNSSTRGNNNDPPAPRRTSSSTSRSLSTSGTYSPLRLSSSDVTSNSTAESVPPRSANCQFRVLREPKPKQRKSYKNENRYLAPNPLQVGWCGDGDSPEGYVTALLADESGEPLSAERQNELVGEHVQSLNEDGVAQFSLKMHDTSRGTWLRLRFQIQHHSGPQKGLLEWVCTAKFRVDTNIRKS